MVEGLRHLDRLLAGHRVDDEQRLGRRHLAGDPHQLVHHRLVHVQPARRVEQHEVVAALPRRLHAGARDLQGGCPDRPGVDLDPHLVAQLHELVDGGRTVHIGGHQQRLASVLAQAHGQLGGGRRLAGALQPDQHHDCRTRVEAEPMALAAEHLHQLVVDDLHHLLARLDAVQDVGTQGSLPYAGDEVLHHPEVDVRLEQGEADLPERDVQVGFGDLGLATQAVGDRLQAR